MPLKKGTSRETVSGNIRELKSSGYGVKQALAIALHHAHPQQRPKATRKNRIRG